MPGPDDALAYLGDGWRRATPALAWTRRDYGGHRGGGGDERARAFWEAAARTALRALAAVLCELQVVVVAAAPEAAAACVHGLTALARPVLVGRRARARAADAAPRAPGGAGALSGGRAADGTRALSGKQRAAARRQSSTRTAARSRTTPTTRTSWSCPRPRPGKAPSRRWWGLPARRRPRGAPLL